MLFHIKCSICKSQKTIDMPVDTFEVAKEKFVRDKIGILLDHGVCSAVWEIHEIPKTDTSRKSTTDSVRIGTHNVLNAGTEKDTSGRTGVVKETTGNIKGS